MVGPGDLDCRLVGLRAAAHGERAVQRARRDLRDLANELNRRRYRRPLRHIVERRRLLIDDIPHLGPPVPDVDGPLPRGHVDPRAAFRVRHPQTVTLDGDHRPAVGLRPAPVVVVEPNVTVGRTTQFLGGRAFTQRHVRVPRGAPGT